MMHRRLFLLLSALLCLLSTACGNVNTVIVDKVASLPDGTGTSYELDPGMYKVDVTASEDGVTVKFIGSSCSGTSTETMNFSTICQFTQSGQVTIDNPSMFGAGDNSAVTVKITRLWRA